MEASSGAHALYCFAEAVAAAASAAPAEAQGEYVEPAVASSTSPVCAPSAAGDAAGPALASSCAPGAGDGPSAGAAATLTPAAAAHDDDGAAPASTPPDADEAPDADEVAPNADDASPDADEAPDADDADDADEEPHDPDEPTWCVCDRGFFGEMVGCDGEDKCEFGGWFHIECVGLARAPRGEWRCASCTEKHAITSERKKRKADKDRALAKRLRPDSATHIVVEEGPSRSSYTLKIETAEDQSRREMERLIGGARGIRFSQGRAVGEPDIEGLCRLELVKKTFAAISSLHKTIVKRLRKEKMLVPWAGVNEGDARERGYAFLPKTKSRIGSRASRSRKTR
ncbi:hypothetical protein M885DRAFT_584731 [Pelagophyceae sp. CCMP2097]|nr:hypothetical protein M885DRAFT_584731 [Pelagophyceae sp. CCMP2097]